ncbi:fimbrillin family protein, partial [Akkermansia sp. BIOML-A61]
YTRATMDISTGSLTKTTAGNVEFSAGATLTDKAVSFSSIVVPVDATAGKDMQAVFTIDGKQLQFTFPAGTKWERSYRNIYDIVLGNNGLVIGGADGSGVTIEPWTDDVKGEIQLVPVI